MQDKYHGNLSGWPKAAAIFLFLEWISKSIYIYTIVKISRVAATPYLSRKKRKRKKKKKKKRKAEISIEAINHQILAVIYFKERKRVKFLIAFATKPWNIWKSMNYSRLHQNCDKNCVTQVMCRNFLLIQLSELHWICWINIRWISNIGSMEWAKFPKLFLKVGFNNI